MTLRRRPSKRDVEKAHYEREARLAFGHAGRSTVQSVSQASTPSMGQEIDEAKRLAAKHDPSRQSACRLCGQTTGRDWTEVAGWKLCRSCQPLLPGGLAAVLGHLLGQPVEPSEAVDVLDCVPSPNPCYFPGKWPSVAGQEHPWGHLPEDFAARGREALAQVRRLRDPSPKLNTYGSGCAWCGVSRSPRWTDAPWRDGRGRQARRWALCAQCHPWALAPVPTAAITGAAICSPPASGCAAHRGTTTSG